MDRRSTAIFAALLALAATAAPAFAQLPALRDRPLSAVERTRYAALETRFAQVSQQRSVFVSAVRAITRALGERLDQATSNAGAPASPVGDQAAQGQSRQP